VRDDLRGMRQGVREALNAALPGLREGLPALR
jgi:flagellar hook-length control protein FliK